MPEIYVFGKFDGRLRSKIRSRFADIPIHRDSVVLTEVESIVFNVKNISIGYIWIESSKEMSDEDIITIANHFVEIVDVSLRSGKGIMVFREAGKKFEPSCLDSR